MANMNIDLPAALRARMEPVWDAVDWSQVAARAFELRLAEIAAAAQPKSLGDVVQRLRGTRLDRESDAERAGRDAGTRWAKETATWAELERVADLDETSLGEGEPDELGWAGIVYRAVTGDHGERWGRGDLERFWEAVAREGSPSPEFLRGFCAGASAVLETVREAVEA